MVFFWVPRSSVPFQFGSGFIALWKGDPAAGRQWNSKSLSVSAWPDLDAADYADIRALSSAQGKTTQK